MTDFQSTQVAAQPVVKLDGKIREAVAECFVEILQLHGWPEAEKLKPGFLKLLENGNG